MLELKTFIVVQFQSFPSWLALIAITFEEKFELSIVSDNNVYYMLVTTS